MKEEIVGHFRKGETKTRKEVLDNFDKNGKIYYSFNDFNG